MRGTSTSQLVDTDTMVMYEVSSQGDLLVHLVGRTYGIDSLVQYPAKKAADLVPKLRNPDSALFLTCADLIMQYQN